jgi:hypothetical protein
MIYLLNMIFHSYVSSLEGNGKKHERCSGGVPDGHRMISTGTAVDAWQVAALAQANQKLVWRQGVCVTLVELVLY